MGRSCGQRSEEAEDRIDVAVDVVQIAAVAAAVAVADAEIALSMQVSWQLHARHRRRKRGMCSRKVRFGTRGSGRRRLREAGAAVPDCNAVRVGKVGAGGCEAEGWTG